MSTAPGTPQQLPNPPVGTRDATLRDQVRSLVWVGLAIGTRVFSTRTTVGQWITSVIILIVVTAVAVAVGIVAVQGTLVSLGMLAAMALTLVITATLLSRRARRRRTRHYVLDHGTAVLSVTAVVGTWHIAGHGRAARASGAGKQLRELLMPELVAAADTQDVAIVAIAAAPGLARTYQTELPGLLDVGTAWPYGRRLYRPRRSDREALCADMQRRGGVFHA